MALLTTIKTLHVDVVGVRTPSPDPENTDGKYDCAQ